MKAILILCSLIPILGCSNQQIYTAIQDSHRLECSKLPQQQYEDCLKEHETTYQEYERDRQDLEREKGH